MDSKFTAILSAVLIPQTVALLAEKDGLDEVSALNEFYRSRTYELLLREETKLWHYSPLTLYNMYEEEKKEGKINFPEG